MINDYETEKNSKGLLVFESDFGKYFFVLYRKRELEPEKSGARAGNFEFLKIKFPYGTMYMVL